MAVTTYQNFDLTITHLADEEYRAEAASQGGGQPSTKFTNPFSPEELASFREVPGRLARDARRTPTARAQAAADLRNEVKNLGGRLHEAVFADDVRAGFSSSLQTARKQGAGLRIRLRLEQAPELAQLPWEYLYRGSDQQYLALSEQTPIVRFLPLPDPPPALEVEPPLNVLVMIASPDGYTQLAVDTEWKKIHDGLKQLKPEEQKQVSIDKLEVGTRDSCQSQLKKKKYHVFHFIGHGDFDPATNAAALIFEDHNGKADPISGEFLRVLLDHFDLRLVILNACEGARASPLDPFAGVAQSLVQAGIPAVIAMQFKITDQSAILFAENFYRALALGHSVDTCLAEARKAIYLKKNPTEWGTPVLFMRSPEGRLFRVVGEEQRRQARIRELSEEAQAFVEQGRWRKAIDILEHILKVEAGAVPV